MQPIIKVENLGKSYLIGHQRESYVALRDVLVNKARQTASNAKKFFTGGQLVAGNKLEEFWALKDINFEVQQGDRVGIIGRNGAGKSTLLKVLSRITEPTTGRIHLKGRVASLLEVGTGFHPELSGRENIYLNGAILGMSQVEVRKKFDEIVDFAGVEKFLDTPVKRYSSGMYVRLAFAVAAHLEPEILIIDEVLAVGDAEFQKKCLGKMEDVSKNEGRTVLFVSHNMGAIDQLCNRVILLDQGVKKIDSKSVKEVISNYLYNDKIISKSGYWEKKTDKIHSPYIDVTKFHITTNSQNIENYSFTRDLVVNIHIEFNVVETNKLLEVGCYIYDENENIVFVTQHTDQAFEDWPDINLGENKLQFSIPPFLLNEGTYKVELVSFIYQNLVIYYRDKGSPSIFFSIKGNLSKSPYWYSKRDGSIAPIIEWIAH